MTRMTITTITTHPGFGDSIPMLTVIGVIMIRTIPIFTGMIILQQVGALAFI